MLNCHEVSRMIELYLDKELRGSEIACFEAHIADCHSCRTQLEREELFFALLQSPTPLYTAPEPLREKITELVETKLATKNNQPIAIPEKVAQPRSIKRFYFAAPIAAMIIILVLITGIYWQRAELSQPISTFARNAVNQHLRRQRGQLPLEITTTSAKEVMDWFSGKLSFNVKMPNYDDAPESAKLYNLEGARLIGIDNDYAAYVSYRMQGRLISLVIASAVTAQPQGGEVIRSNGIDFHFEMINGLKVITWTDNGLIYSLISDLAERGQASCVVCHQDKQQQITAPFKK